MSISEARSPMYFVYWMLRIWELSAMSYQRHHVVSHFSRKERGEGGAPSSVISAAAGRAARLLPFVVIELRFHALLFARSFFGRGELTLFTAAQFAVRDQPL